MASEHNRRFQQCRKLPELPARETGEGSQDSFWRSHQSWVRRSRTRSIPVSLAPGVVILHGKAENGRTIMVDHRFGELEEQRVSRRYRHIHFTAQNEVSLRVRLINAVEERGGPERVTGISRNPELVVQSIADVPLKSR